jgi:hypothetical protein
MNKIVIALLVISLAACKSEKEKEKERLQSNCKTYFIENFKDSTSTLDTFKLVSIDTISESMLLFEQSSVLNNQLESLIDLYKLNTRTLSNSVDQMRLYGMLGSSELVAIEKKDALKATEKGKVIKFEIDTLMAIIKTIDDKSLTADTIKPIGFQAKCYYQIRLKDKSVKQDTTFILLNLNKDIIKRKDFLKLPYTIDFDKFD